jgi:predicted RNA-binding Zn-ribbon protein involved in translation (DUF1610 family)
VLKVLVEIGVQNRRGTCWAHCATYDITTVSTLVITMLESKTHTRVVTATSSGEHTTGELIAVEFGTRERSKRAMLTALKCLGCTLVCLFIPGAHFILVPLGLLLTPVVTFFVWRVRTKILSAKIACPKCGGTVQVLTMQERYPLYETCSSCHREIAITVAH